MQIRLTRKVLKELSVDVQPPPGVIGEGTLAQMIPNPDREPYYLWDATYPGFGVYVGRRGITFQFFARNATTGKKVQVNLGRYNPMTLDEAKAAADAAYKRLRGGANLNAEKRDGRQILGMTLNQAFEAYITHYKRTYKARTGRDEHKANTVHFMEAQQKRLDKLCTKALSDISREDAAAAFDRILGPKNHQTAAESAIKVGFRVFRYIMTLDAEQAQEHKRDLLLTHNPFEKAMRERCRTRSVQMAQIRENGARNPLRNATVLGMWLDAAWDKRNKAGRGRNPTASDFLVLNLLLGTRRSELGLHWGDRCTDAERETENYADLGRRVVVLNRTKNNVRNVLPLGRLATRILAERLQARGKGDRFVFEHPKNFPDMKVQHYSDPGGAFLAITRQVSGQITGTALEHSVRWMKRTKKGESYRVIKLGLHDLRRSFATLASTVVPYFAVQGLLNHSSDDVTTLYIDLDIEAKRGFVQTIEDALLAQAPGVQAWLGNADDNADK